MTQKSPANRKLGQAQAPVKSKKKEKGKTQERTPMQRVMVLKEGRRKVLEWRPWD